MIREIALKVPSSEGTINLKPIAGMPESGLPTLNAVIRLGIVYLFVASVIATLFFIIWGGIQWASSGGDPKAIDNAKKRISFAIVGLIITFLAFFIINVVGGIFGISLLHLK